MKLYSFMLFTWLDCDSDHSVTNWKPWFLDDLKKNNCNICLRACVLSCVHRRVVFQHLHPWSPSRAPESRKMLRFPLIATEAEEGEWRQKGAKQKRKLSWPQPLPPPAVGTYAARGKTALTLPVWWMRMASLDCWERWKLWEMGNIASMWRVITRCPVDFWRRRSWTRWVITGAALCPTGSHLEKMHRYRHRLQVRFESFNFKRDWSVRVSPKSQEACFPKKRCQVSTGIQVGLVNHRGRLKGAALWLHVHLLRSEQPPLKTHGVDPTELRGIPRPGRTPQHWIHPGASPPLVLHLFKASLLYVIKENTDSLSFFFPVKVLCMAAHQTTLRWNPGLTSLKLVISHPRVDCAPKGSPVHSGHPEELKAEKTTAGTCRAYLPPHPTLLESVKSWDPPERPPGFSVSWRWDSNPRG